METQLVQFDDGAETVLARWGDDGPALLCVHGMTSSRVGWTRFAQHFATTHRVFAYDQRGHGDMAGITGPMSLERSVRDAETVARAIGGEIEAAIGHSWGGAIVIRAAEHLRARKTIAVDPVVRQVSRAWYDEYLEELTATFGLFGAERDARIREEYAGAHPLDIEGKVHAVHAMVAQTLERLRDENPPERWDLRAEIAGFARPLLLALADPSQSIIAGDDYRMLETLENPAVTVEVFEGEGHSLHRSAFEAFVTAVERFLQR